MKEAFWDLFVLKANGDWVGLRAPWKSLRKISTLLALLLILAGFGLTGWLLSRWQVSRLDRALSFERLKAEGLQAELAAVRLGTGTLPPGTGASSPAADSGAQVVSFLPNLDALELESPFLKMTNAKSAYEARSTEYQVEFTLTRQGPREGRPRSYTWVALLHGPQGLLVFPSVLRSRGGDVLSYERGQVLEDFKSQKTVTARFKLRDFFESDGSLGAIHTTFVVYDGGSGSPLLRKRVDLGYAGSSSSVRERTKP